MSIVERFKTSGIRERLTLLMVTVGLFFLIAVLGLMVPFMRWNLTNQLATQQKSQLTTIQMEIDSKISSAKTQLAAVAGVLPQEALHDQALAQHFLENRVGIAEIFDNGLALLSPQGKLLAETPRQPDRTIFDFSSYPFFQQAIATRVPTVSEPFRSTKPPHHPVVQFCVPIYNHEGRLAGVFSGGIRLNGDHVIGSIAKHKIGASGYLYLYSQDRTMLVHPDITRIMQKDVPPGSNLLFDKALSGWEGTGITINSLGLKAVASFAHIKSAPWILASNYPVDEAFKPVKRATAALLGIITLFGIISMTLSWFVLRSITRPLAQLTGHLQQLGDKHGTDRQFHPIDQPSQEILLLTDSFNQMLQDLDQQQEEISGKVVELREQADILEQEMAVRQRTEEELKLLSDRHQAIASLLRSICDNVPDMIWAKDTSNNYLFVNKAICEKLLVARDTNEPLGKNDLFFALRQRAVYPERNDWHTFGELCFNSDLVVLQNLMPQMFHEFGNVEGEYLCLDVNKAPLFNDQGVLLGTVGCGRIVTREKQLEHENAQLARLYRILSEVNQKFVHRPDPHQLLQFVCDTLLSDDTFVMVWIGLPDGMGGYFPAVAAGIPMEQLLAHGSEHPSGMKKQVITGINAQTSDQLLCPECQNLYQHRSFTSVASYMIQPDKALPALLVLYASDSKLFDYADELGLLNELVGDIAYALDVAEDERLKSLSMQQLELAAAVFENSSEGIVITDAQERIISVNRAFCEITGYQSVEVVGQTPRLIKSDRHDRDFYQAMWHILTETGRWQGEIWNRRKDGQVYPELLAISAVQNETGAVGRYIAVFSDISQIKASEQQIDYLEWRDPLTNLPNRRMVFAHLSQALDLARRNEQAVALLCLDLDNFKDINDSFGHLTGDALLRLTAQRLRDRMRSSDMVARLGGDEFIVLVEGLEHIDHVPLIAEEILSLLQMPFKLESGIEVQTSVSVGIALFPDHGTSAMELLQKADAALYQAKQRGRAQFAYFSDDMTEKAVERVQLGNHIRRAVEQHELKIHYQPQVDLSNGAIVGAEALMRWQSPELGMISPARFIPLAEEIGCIIQMGEWILRQVCLQGRQWLDAGFPPVTLAVNLSPLQIRQPNLVTMVEDILDVSGFPAELLELELTESALIHHEKETIGLLHELHGLGIKLALDDFGTGYSSLAYLKHFPLHLLKIDKSFVDDLPNGLNDCKIATTIVNMGRSLGFKLLAEGVEREDQLAFLQTLGCDLYQGYLMSKPLPADEFTKLLRKNTHSS